MTKKRAKQSHRSEQSKNDASASVAPILYGTQPSAGFPMPGDDFTDKTLNLNDLLIQNPISTFFVTVAGDSMEGARLFAGDILVVDRSVVPRTGAIVVAAVYGELVVKLLGIHKGQPALLSASAGYEPILVAESDEVTIWGVVVGSARSFMP